MGCGRGFPFQSRHECEAQVIGEDCIKRDKSKKQNTKKIYRMWGASYRWELRKSSNKKTETGDIYEHKKLYRMCGASKKKWKTNRRKYTRTQTKLKKSINTKGTKRQIQPKICRQKSALIGHKNIFLISESKRGDDVCQSHPCLHSGLLATQNQI